QGDQARAAREQPTHMGQLPKSSPIPGLESEVFQRFPKLVGHHQVVPTEMTLQRLCQFAEMMARHLATELRSLSCGARSSTGDSRDVARAEPVAHHDSFEFRRRPRLSFR